MFEVESSKISIDHDMLSTESTLANVEQKVSHTDRVAEVVNNDIHRPVFGTLCVFSYFS